MPRKPVLPNESLEYRRARNALLEDERQLRRHIEEVAQKRRELPFGGTLKTDYPLTEAATGAPLKFSDLFVEGQDTLVVYCCESACKSDPLGWVMII